MGKDAFQPWTKLEHPQLGEVEIGGMDFKFTMQNCPPAYLQREVGKDHPLLPAPCGGAAAPVHRHHDGRAAGRGRICGGSRGGQPRIPAHVPDAGSAEHEGGSAAQCRIDRAAGRGGNHGPEERADRSSRRLAGIPSSYGYDFITTSKHDPLCKSCNWVVKGQSGQTVSLCVKGAKAGKAQAEVVLP